MKRCAIRQEHDIEWLREVHKLAFPEDLWPGDDDKFWIATRGTDLVGFASARPRGDMLELTRCAVVAAETGRGLQRRFLAVREAYARRNGCKTVCTYTTMGNYPSITNLIRAGYRFSPLQTNRGYFNFVKYLSRKLSRKRYKPR